MKPEGSLSHVDERGAARMVDVSAKPLTSRSAVAGGLVHAAPETITLIAQNALKKGDVLSAARLAGVMAAKKTSELVPLCHAIPLEMVDITFELQPEAVRITATAGGTARTGMEMEALTAVTVAALTIYDMCKAVDRAMSIDEIRLLCKTGGASGDYKYSGDR